MKGSVLEDFMIAAHSGLSGTCSGKNLSWTICTLHDYPSESKSGHTFEEGAAYLTEAHKTSSGWIWVVDRVIKPTYIAHMCDGAERQRTGSYINWLPALCSSHR